MTTNFLGLGAAGAAFVSIWLGHVAVRRIEAASSTIWIPAVLCAVLGAGLELGSVLATNRLWSAVSGIVGVAVLWDAIEFTRQQRRVCSGHAPANPNNPRHARILANFRAATVINMLKREPVGRPISEAEAIKRASQRLTR